MFVAMGSCASDAMGYDEMQGDGPQYGEQNLRTFYAKLNNSGVNGSDAPGGLEEIDLADSAADPSRAKSKRIVPLWTLASAATCSVCGCGYMLYREWRKKKDFG